MRSIQPYFRVLSFLLLLGIVYVCIHYNNKNESTSVYTNKIWKNLIGIHSQARSVFQLVSGAKDNCDGDHFVEMEKYLESRRSCILKYCGDVCNTRIGSDQSNLYHIKIII